ncbi:hypothetical protein [Undibacterium aquatile]|uniref:Uncharacterized protein n=1 Tax=Undibacterium aquatile TaxID=1537398 RepID=A0ABR6XAM4_9BURK|nr:hypothetical protein [Undibacterium aquatile]MBC3809876.1 hypothetical protein [Undibacterium aquatile]
MTDLFEILKSWPAASAAIVAGIAAIIKSIQSIFEFHSEHLRNRKLKRLEILAKECEENGDLKLLVRRAKDEEISRNLLGRICTPEFTEALARSYESGRLTLSMLRAALPYIEVINGSLHVNLGLQSKVLFWFSTSLVLAMSIYFSWLILLLSKVQSAGAYGAMLVVAVFYLAFVRFVGGDARAVIAARRVREKLGACTDAT